MSTGATAHPDAYAAPSPADMAARLNAARCRAGVLAFATRRSEQDIAESFRSARVQGMPEGWPVVAPTAEVAKLRRLRR